MTEEEVSKTIEDYEFKFSSYHKGVAKFYAHIETTPGVGLDVFIDIGYATYQEAYDLSFSYIEKFDKVGDNAMSAIKVLYNEEEMFYWWDDNY